MQIIITTENGLLRADCGDITYLFNTFEGLIRLLDKSIFHNGQQMEIVAPSHSVTIPGVLVVEKVSA